MVAIMWGSREVVVGLVVGASSWVGGCSLFLLWDWGYYLPGPVPLSGSLTQNSDLVFQVAEVLADVLLIKRNRRAGV